MNELNIATVIVTFNRSEILKKNLHSFHKQGDLTYFIVDNNSKDNTSKIVEEFKNYINNKVFYFKLNENTGGAGGFAFGCKQALEYKNESFTHLWLSDDDVAFAPDCLEQLKPYIDNKTILQPIHFNFKNEICWYNSNIDFSFSLKAKLHPITIKPMKDKGKPFIAASVPFEGPLIPITVFKKIGLPDKRYFIQGDDVDFSLKATSSGFEIKFIPQAIINRLIDNHMRFTSTSNHWQFYFVYRNTFRLYKIFGQNKLVRSNFYLFILFILRIFKYLITGNLKRVVIIKNAFFDGISQSFNINKKYIPKN